MPFFDNMLKRSSKLCENLKFVQGLDIYVFLFRVFWFACILILLWRRYLVLVGYVYNYASQVLMDVWDCNVFFFYDFFKNFPCELKETVCFRVE